MLVRLANNYTPREFLLELI